MEAMHTHFASATTFIGTLLNVLLGLTLWRLAWAHVLAAPKAPAWLHGLARAALFQSG